MKLIALLMFFMSFTAFSGDMGEDASNIDCTNSIHRPRPTVAQIKNSIEFSEDTETEAEESTHTIQK